MWVPYRRELGTPSANSSLVVALTLRAESRPFCLVVGAERTPGSPKSGRSWRLMFISAAGQIGLFIEQGPNNLFDGEAEAIASTTRQKWLKQAQMPQAAYKSSFP